MIGYIRGTVAWAEPDMVVLEAGGIGYQIGISALAAQQLPKSGSQLQLYTYMYIREDVLALYGFYTREELDMFQRLIQVNGVGPKAAMSIFGVLTVNDLKFAILSEDAKAIAKAPGIGAKSAQRIIIELKDKVSLEDAFGERLSSQISGEEDDSQEQDAIMALTSLGYGSTEAAKAVHSIEDYKNLSSQQLIKLALRRLF